jgi:THO complex subunit 3
MEFRSATAFSGGHSDDVDYVSWNPTHPELFCTSSQKDRRIIFWDARRECCFNCVHMLAHPNAGSVESRYVQQCSLKVSPVQTCYSPDGRSLLYTSAGNQLFYMTLCKDGEDTKEQWRLIEREPVRIF